jgi:hypothetical protein
MKILCLHSSVSHKNSTSTSLNVAPGVEKIHYPPAAPAPLKTDQLPQNFATIIFTLLPINSHNKNISSK